MSRGIARGPARWQVATLEIGYTACIFGKMP